MPPYLFINGLLTLLLYTKITYNDIYVVRLNLTPSEAVAQLNTIQDNMLRLSIQIAKVNVNDKATV